MKQIPDSLKDRLSESPITYRKSLNNELIESAGFIIEKHTHSKDITLVLDMIEPEVYEYSTGFRMGTGTNHSAAISNATGKIGRARLSNMIAFLSNRIDKSGLINGSELPAYYKPESGYIKSTPAELEALQAASKQLTPLDKVCESIPTLSRLNKSNKELNAKINSDHIPMRSNKVKPVITESTPEPEPIKSTTDIMRERLSKVEAKPLPSELKPAKSQANKPPQYSSEVMTQIAKQIYNLPGIKLEICGAWLWVSGNTREHATELKAAGLKYASKKQMWFYAGKPAWTKFHKPMDEIRSKYGSKNIDEYITA